MKKDLFISMVVFLMVMIGYSCSSSKKTQADMSPEEMEAKLQTIVPDTFVLPDIPEEITNADDRAKYLVAHYWDRFDFANKTLIQKPHITEQAFVDYINILTYVPSKNAEESLVYTLQRAETDSAMYVHFASLFEKYFYEPNSPFHNESFYLPVLREMAKSDMLPAEAKSRYEFQLEMVSKNNVGQMANDFTYTLASGQSSNLYSIKSEYVLLMFSNPECNMCMSVTNQLNQSVPIQGALSRNTPARTMLTIMTLYPDNDVEGWRAHLSNLPQNWLHAYDKGMEITYKRLYDLKAIPSLYLLDKNKKVILKDTSVGAIEAFFS